MGYDFIRIGMKMKQTPFMAKALYTLIGIGNKIKLESFFI